MPVLGQTSTPTARNPVVTFTSPGTKQVTLEVCNVNGCDTLVKSVVVLDPLPQIVSLGTIPARLFTGESFSLTVQSTGRPPLTHIWRITGLSGNLTLTGNPAIWSTASPGVGTFQVQLEVRNVDGSVLSSPLAVAVVVPGIFSDGFESGGSGAWQVTN